MFNTVRLILPALIPSWRFFKTVAPSPRVEYRLHEAAGTTPWQEADPRPVHVGGAEMLRRMLWNARWNEALFLSTCAERLIATEDGFFERELNQRIAARLPDQSGKLQFRLIFVVREGDQLERHVLFESAPQALADLAGSRP